MRDRDGFGAGEPVSPLEIPPDVEKRFQELQEEMRQAVTLAPSVTQGESREERYLRRQRLRARREEFERNARYPRRVLNSPLTIGAMIGAILLLCSVSIFGGAVLGGALDKQPDITATTTKFWNAMENEDYGVAHESLNPLSPLQDFELGAQTAQEAMGDITKWSLVPGSQQGGSSTDRLGTATYTIQRSGGLQVKAASYNVTLKFTYSQTSGWIITDLGAIFDIPKS